MAGGGGRGGVARGRAEAVPVPATIVSATATAAVLWLLFVKVLDRFGDLARQLAQRVPRRHALQIERPLEEPRCRALLRHLWHLRLHLRLHADSHLRLPGGDLQHWCCRLLWLRAGGARASLILLALAEQRNVLLLLVAEVLLLPLVEGKARGTVATVTVVGMAIWVALSHGVGGGVRLSQLRLRPSQRCLLTLR